MGFAVKCFFSDASSKAIRLIWDDLANESLAQFMKDSGSRPGVTLGVWAEATADELSAFAEVFAKVSSGVKVLSYGVATFPTEPAHVFLPLVPSTELLGLHSRFHNGNRELMARCSAYYQPGSWVPHSTLAIRCDLQQVPRIIEVCLKYDTRIAGEIVSIGVIETGTAREISEFPFVG
ncbi:hypothetical protein WDW86_16440 [Bdellovibrionota bacterium FG-2]